MKIGNKNISKKMLVFAILTLVLAVPAFAALINYAVSSMTATVNVSPQAGLTVGVVEGFAETPTNGTITWQTTGTVNLTNITSGDVSIVTIMLNNPTTANITTTLNLSVSYFDVGGVVGDPNNCGSNGSYVAPGAGNCSVCGGQLCISGQEFDVVGLAMWNGALARWDPTVFNNPFSTLDCVDMGLTVPGAFNANGYLDLTGTACFWNVKSTLLGAVTPANPLVASSPVTIQPGVQYIAVALKTVADPANNIQIAPGQYSLTVSTS